MTLSRDRTGLDPSKLPDWREDPGSIPPGAKPLYVMDSAQGVAISTRVGPITQAQYDALAVKDASTEYIVIG